VLNCCRTLAYLRDGLICSKDEGGEWALGALPSSFHNIVRTALRMYREDSPVEPPAAEEIDAFAVYLRDALVAQRSARERTLWNSEPSA
jgi:streptomycin 3"-adenylyltransferase